MKRILRTVLLAICCLASAGSAAAQTVFEMPKIEYANDLSELRLRRVFVYSSDPVSRQALVKELTRERGLLDIVERAEDADFLVVYETPPGEGTDAFAAPAGRATVTGTLLVYRLIETCDGTHPRVLFATRKTKTVHGGIPLPLTPLSRGEFGPSGLTPTPLSRRRVGAELAVRGGLFLIGKLFPNSVRFDQLNGSLSVSSGGKVEAMLAKELLKQVKKARKERKEGLPLDSRQGPATTGSANPAVGKRVSAPCQPKSSIQARPDYGSVGPAALCPCADGIGPPPAARQRRVVRAGAPTRQ